MPWQNTHVRLSRFVCERSERWYVSVLRSSSYSAYTQHVLKQHLCHCGEGDTEGAQHNRLHFCCAVNHHNNPMPIWQQAQHDPHRLQCMMIEGRLDRDSHRMTQNKQDDGNHMFAAHPFCTRITTLLTENSGFQMQPASHLLYS